ncbi:MAG TPA: TatD family hydrolase [Actinomycetota bacterium]|nr:TatD family hydrolase [Actinomycetota bacterium]
MEALAETPQPEAEVVDTHCHLFLMEGEAPTIVQDAREAGVTAIVCVGVDHETSRLSRDLADAISGVFATAGVHPHTASAFDAAVGGAIEELLADPRVVAVGESGLDYFRLRSPKEEQQRALRVHCALARETGKAIVVHVRDAWVDAMAILEEERLDRVVLHCFTGDEAVAAEAGARGYFCSFAGPITYPTNEALRKAAAILPEERLLVETDSPFLPPQPLRGRENEPRNAVAVVDALAAARETDPWGVAAATTRNARAAFGLPG